MWQLEWASQAVSGKKYPEMTVSDAVRDTVIGVRYGFLYTVLSLVSYWGCHLQAWFSLLRLEILG